MGVELRLLPDRDLPLAAGVTAAAFSESPFYSYIFSGAASKEAALTWLFERNFRMRANQGVLQGAFDAENKLLGCFMLVSEEAPSPGLWQMLRHGLLEMPFRFGLASVRRMLSVMEFTDGSLEHLKQQHPKHFLLERMVVLPDCQGQGVGTAALTAALKEADALGRTVPRLRHRTSLGNWGKDQSPRVEI